MFFKEKDEMSFFRTYGFIRNPIAMDCVRKHHTHRLGYTNHINGITDVMTCRLQKHHCPAPRFSTRYQ